MTDDQLIKKRGGPGSGEFVAKEPGVGFHEPVLVSMAEAAATRMAVSKGELVFLLRLIT